MDIRRVATGYGGDGKAMVASDTAVQGIRTGPWEFHLLWGTDAKARFPDDGARPHAPNFFPPLEGCRFMVMTLEPESWPQPAPADPSAALAEIEAKLPGLLAPMEADGMHATNSIDFEYVIEGEVTLELDDGREVLLKAGDTLVQNGTRHRWHNRSSTPCRIVLCLVGAHRVGA
jgi:mannose-6-phosphate isomerase-like protein (cupin superfamily)